jgi:hypothetical protein
MLSISAATVVFGESFTQVIDILTEGTDPLTGEPSSTPSTEIPTVTASFEDPGVSVVAEPGKVTISGTYQTIIQTPWTSISNSGVLETSLTPPSVGTFQKITKVDSPPSLTQDCIYTIDSDTFTHTVDLVSYTGIANTLKSLLATV